MIKFEECSISADGLSLHIRASVIDTTEAKNLYIKKLYIDTENTVLPNTPSNNAYNKDFGVLEEVAFLVGEEGEASTVASNQQTIYNMNSINVILKSSDLGIANFNDDIFFVYIELTGSPTSLVESNKYSSTIVMNLNTVYNKILSHIKELDSNCCIPRMFIDSILRLKALDLSIKTKNNVLTASYWKKLFNKK